MSGFDAPLGVASARHLCRGSRVESAASVSPQDWSHSDLHEGFLSDCRKSPQFRWLRVPLAQRPQSFTLVNYTDFRLSPDVVE